MSIWEISDMMKSFLWKHCASDLLNSTGIIASEIAFSKFSPFSKGKVMAKKGKVVWVRKGAYVMPVLPESLAIHPILAGFLHMLAFLELSDDETVDLDWTVEAMEHVYFYLQRLSDEQIAEFQEQLEKVVAHAKKKRMPKEFIELVQGLVNWCQGEDGDHD